MSARDVVAEKRDAIMAAAGRHGASRLRLIGSVARGTDTPESDIDFLVDWEPWTSLLDGAALKMELEKILGRKVDLASDGWIRSELQAGIYCDALPL